MVARKLKVIITALAAATAAFFLFTSVGTAGKGPGSQKLEGAWIAKVSGTPAQWSYVVVPEPSGRRASAHGAVEVGPNVEEIFGPYDRLSPLLVDIEMTGPETAIYNSIWYGVRELQLPSPFKSELVFIGASKGTLTFVGPGKATGLHNFEFYFPAQDADGDGLPDSDEAPVYTLQLATDETRLPPPQ